MHRDIDPRDTDRDRPDLPRGGRGGHEPDRLDLTNDPREALARDLDLPRGRARETVRRPPWQGELRGSQVRTLAAAGAFRVVPMDALRQPDERLSLHRKDVERLRAAGLVRTVPYVVGRTRTTLVTLTDEGRAVLEASRREREDRSFEQRFYAGIAKPRELAHDARVYQAYLRAAERIADRGGHVRRVVLEEDLKREYQTFLQEPNRGRRGASGRSPRDAEEIAQWAHEHRLPVVDDHVQLPDVRIEYDTRDGRREIEDVEVMTPHYRGAHAAAKVRAGFTRYAAMGARLSGSSGARRSGRAPEARFAEEMLS